MNRVRLYYKDLAEIVGSDGFSVVRLTDEKEKRALCVVCDKTMTTQMSIRFNRMPGREMMLPEVLSGMLLDDGRNVLEITVYDVVDGQYRVTLLNKTTLAIKHIRMSDAVLLHYITRIPFYIDEQLMVRQCTPYLPETNGISIPINTIDTERLNKELERAIEQEDYRLASHLHNELQKRKKR